MKKLRFFLIGLLTFLILAACSSSQETGEGETKESGEGTGDEKVTVVFWHSMGGAGLDSLNGIVDEYNQSQDEIDRKSVV